MPERGWRLLPRWRLELHPLWPRGFAPAIPHLLPHLSPCLRVERLQKCREQAYRKWPIRLLFPGNLHYLDIECKWDPGFRAIGGALEAKVLADTEAKSELAVEVVGNDGFHGARVETLFAGLRRCD